MTQRLRALSRISGDSNTGPIARSDRFAVGGIDIDPRQISPNMWQRHQLRVHHPEPQPGHIGQQIHTVLAVGHFRNIVEVAQALVAAGGVGVMVGVALQVVEHHIAENVVGVPAVVGPA